MKKIIIIVVSLLLIFVCIFALSGFIQIKQAEATVTGMFDALKHGDTEKTAKYINLDDLKNPTLESDSLSNDTDLLIKNAFNNLDYKIITSELKDSTTVIVKTEITNINMSTVRTEFFKEVMEYAFTAMFYDPQPTEQENKAKMEEFLVTTLTRPDIPTVTNTINITVSKTKDNSWKIQVDNAFLETILGDLLRLTSEKENNEPEITEPEITEPEIEEEDTVNYK
ncbi:MAG: hypothetical protein PHH22_03870 [Clostridia bacterium]|nr:hypothetical protein [Clostridia bacterium]